MPKEQFELPEPDTTVEPKDEFEIVIEDSDDTPEPKEPEQKPEPKAQETEEGKPATSEEDLDTYGRKVQKRIKKLTQGYHDAQRDREEAIKFAQAQVEINRQLEARIAQGTQIVAQQAKTSAQLEMDAAKKKLKEAFEAGDADALADAQEAVAEAKWRMHQAENIRPPLQTRQTEVQIPQTSAPALDPRMAEWHEDNDWFLKDPEMTNYALGLDQKLKSQGLDPTSDEFYDAIDARMRKVFPEYDWGDAPKPTEKVEHKKPKSVVAPATRSTAPRKVTLNERQVALAKKMGLTVEQYAQALLNMESQND